MGMINAGDPLTALSARSWNRHELAAEYILSRKHLGDPARQSVDHADSNIVMVRNLAGADLVRGSVVELGDFIVTEDPINSLWFEGNEPDTTRPFAILRRATPEDKIDEAQLSGVVIARVDVQDVDHQYAIVVSGETVLDSATWGPIRLLSPADGAGVQDMAVCLQLVESPLIRGVTDGAISKGSNGTVSRYNPGTTTDSGENDTVENEYANVGSGKKVAYMRNGAKYYMISAECPLT